MKKASTLAVVIALATLAPRNAAAVSKEACVQSHESSQILQKKGQLRAARHELMVCSDEGCPRILRQACAEWLEQLEASMPSIVLEARGANGEPIADVRVTMDGAPFVDHLDGLAVSVDPGEHTFRFESPAGAQREVRVVVPEGQRNFPIAASFEEPHPPVAPGVRSDADATRAGEAQSRRRAGYIVGGVGIAALAAGTVFGVLAISANNEAACPSPCPGRISTGAINPTLVQAREASDRSRTMAWAADVGLGAGIVGIAVAIYLVLTAQAPTPRAGDAPRPTSKSLVPARLPHGAALILEEAF